jgi:hypothetical protein
LVRGRPGAGAEGFFVASSREGISASRRIRRGSGEVGKLRTRGMVVLEESIEMYSGGYMCVWMSTTLGLAFSNCAILESVSWSGKVVYSVNQ